MTGCVFHCGLRAASGAVWVGMQVCAGERVVFARACTPFDVGQPGLFPRSSSSPKRAHAAGR